MGRKIFFKILLRTRRLRNLGYNRLFVSFVQLKKAGILLALFTKERIISHVIFCRLDAALPQPATRVNGRALMPRAQQLMPRAQHTGNLNGAWYDAFPDGERNNDNVFNGT